VLAWPETVARELEAGVGARVWCADLDALAGEHEALIALLPDDERRRAAAMTDGTRRTRFLRARGVLRRLLAEAVGSDEARLPFAYGADGKPALAGPAARDGVHFNLSHAREVALFAITTGARVGVDLAWSGGLVAVDKVIARFFSPAEQAAVEAVSVEARRAAFARIWVRKEAYLKGRGEGISARIYQTDFSTARSEGQSIAGRDQDRWEVTDIAGLPDGFVGSVAVERGGA
jgi:4'-phosphopantetheinyl transferase